MNLATAAQPLALLGTAAAAWRGLTGSQPNQPRPSVPELGLIEQLADKYGAEAEAVSDDVVALLHRLEAEGLVEATQAG